MTGRRVVGCPYFAARALAETAEVVFCPYNYIVDPVIRESVKIDLKVRFTYNVGRQFSNIYFSY